MAFEKALLFETSIFHNKLRLDTDAIEKHCYQVRDKDAGRNVSNIGGWQSTDLNEDDPFFNKIGFISAVREATAMYARGIMGLNFTDVSISNFWININRRGDCNCIHTHPGLQVAGVYYVKVPKGNTGPIRFQRLGNEIMQRDIPAHLIMYYNPENSTAYDVQPEVNNMLVFPGWLPHQVHPTNTDEDRISISFNVNVT